MGRLAPTPDEAFRILHRLWTETDYPPGKRDEHKELWKRLEAFIVADRKAAEMQ